ncbi:uncharacterized protein [Montipora capricornis]|uniref:uncharacterized protein isoform X3 n=1 Tax=Montipora capricornis TaxID=246305 RepID=UPI0035F14A3C
MLLKLDVLTSSTIKRKKPWPKIAWLGKDVGDLFLFDSHRISQLYLPSGKTKKRIPLLQSYLEDVQEFGISSNGLFLAGALNSGRILIWNKSSATVTTTAVLDKIRNVQPGTRCTSHLQVYISDCGGKVVLLTGLHQVFLWEAQGSDSSINVGDMLKGAWLQIQCGTYVLPDERDKEAAANGVFFVDPVCGASFSLSWVFNKSNGIHVTTLHLLWPEKNFTLPVDSSSVQDHIEGIEASFIPTWRTFKHSLYNLTPAERVVKSRKAYVARVSPDGQVLVIAMNQKCAAHNRMMFYSLSQSAVALITDLKGCGAKLSAANHTPMGRCWWVADMAWTRDSLLVICITLRGSVAVLSKLGEPMEICTEGSSLHTGPSFFLPLHPKITFNKVSDLVRGEPLESSTSERDPLHQRFSVSVHPHLPIILSSDGYVVTIMQLPSAASYQGVMTGFMKDVTRLVPDMDVVIQSENLSRVSSVSRINILQCEANISRGFASTEFVSDPPSDNNSTGSSSVVPGYGLASGDQGRSFFGLSDPELENSLPEYNPGSQDAISRAQSLSIMALALGSACGVNWKRETGPAMDLTITVITNLFRYLLWSSGNTGQLQSLAKSFPSSTGDLFKRRSPSSFTDSSQLSRALGFFQMVLEVFQWDACHRNVFSWAFHLTHGIVKGILLTRDASLVFRVTSCMRVLKVAERVLDLVYSNSKTVTGEKMSECTSRDDVVKNRQDRVKEESDKLRSKAGLFKQEFHLSQESIIDNQEFELSKQESKQDDQESNRSQKEGGTQMEVVQNISLNVSSNSQHQSVAQTHLSGTWLLLYKFTSQNYQRVKKKSTSLFSDQEVESKGHNVEKKVVTLICEIQEKLQLLGVRIPFNASVEKDNVEGVSAYLDGKYHSLPSELPQDSLFSRRRSSLQGTVPRGSSPKIWRTHKSPLRDDVENQHSQNTPFRSFPSVSPHDRGKEQDSKTLLSILYLQLQQYDLRSALDLIYSLIEPQLSCDDVESIGTFSVFPNTQVENHTSNGNHRMEVLLQNYPIARVADKRGLEIVQTLARFMSAYFSNLSLYVYPPYQPVPLPAFHDHEQELEGPSPVIERVTLDRTKVGQAVRDQNIHELWSANATLELLLVCGLVSEGAWLANNLGDWKNAMLLSFAGGVLASQFSQSATDSVLRFALPVTPKSMTPHAIFWSRLSSLFNLTDVSGGHKTRSVLFDTFLRSTTSRKSPRAQPISIYSGTEVDDKVVNDLSRILEAGVVANLEFVPIILTRLLAQLKKMTSMLVWIVPEEFYLPYPPSYCPQPASSKKDVTSSDAEKEEKLRLEIAKTVQRILLLLNASRCLAPCVKWYAEQLICVNETWSKVDRSDSEFPVPASVAGYSKQGQSFQESLGNMSPTKKGKKNFSRGQEEKSNEELPQSILSVMGCFREFCAIIWLLHIRDNMSKSSRKYRQLRTQSSGSEEETTVVQSVCWETLMWTTRVVPFSSLLAAEDKINDTLLTLLSELPPTVATAQLTAQFFNDPEVVQTTSGRAKFKRLMALFRGACASDGADGEEPLSVIYCKKCIDWAEELSEREELFGRVCDQFVLVDRGDDTVYFNGSAGRPFPRQDQLIAVGTALFETQSSYFEFLDTFFMITVSRTLLSQQNKASFPVPLLSYYSKHLLSSDTKSITVLRRKAHRDNPSQLVSRASSLFRTQSFTDLRSKPVIPAPNLRDGGEIKRSSSMNDLTKLDSLPGIKTLGSFILDLLPSLTWLSKWALQGSSLPFINFDISSRGSKKSLPVMRVHVPLPLLVNGLWLLQNVYWPWVSNAEVVVDIKVIRPSSPRQKLPATEKQHSAPVLQVDTTPPEGGRLRKVLSDSNIRKSERTSLKRDSISSEIFKNEVDNLSALDIIEKIQADSRSSSYNTTQSKRNLSMQEPIQLTRPIPKDLRTIKQIERIPKSSSEPNIPSIVVHSPTTDEEKDLLGALKKRHTLRGNGKNSKTYYSDPELVTPLKPVVTSTPTKIRHPKKTKRRGHEVAALSDEEETSVTSASEVGFSVTAKEYSTVPPDQFANRSQTPKKTRPQSTIRTAASHQGKRKRKPTIEGNAAPVKEEDDVHEVKDSIDEIVHSGSRQRNAVEAAECSQSSAAEAVVSQRQMELLLVVRPGEGLKPSTLQSGIPLLRIPTVVDSSQSSELTSQRGKTQKAETASQTDRQTLASSASQTPQHSLICSDNHVTRYPNHHGLTSPVSQTMPHSGNTFNQGHVSHDQDQQQLMSHASEAVAVKHYGITSHQSHASHPPTHSVYSQTDPNEEIKPKKTFFPFLLHGQQPTDKLIDAANDSQKPPTFERNNEQFTTATRPLPLLQIPLADPAAKLDLSKMRLLEIPKRSGDSTLFQIPKSKTTISQPTVPDLSKIKFLEIRPKTETRPRDTETDVSGRSPISSKDWPLLRMAASRDRLDGVDFGKEKLNVRPPLVREAWPLLESPKKEAGAKLIPLDRILAFEKGIRDKLPPFTEAISLYPLEKENIRPTEENESIQRKSCSDHDSIAEPQNKRNAPSRQRRRQALEKRTTSPLYKNKRQRGAFRVKSPQKVMKVQPAKKARKDDKRLLRSEPVTKKMKPAEPQKREVHSKKEVKSSVSLSESELDLSEITDDVLKVSEEEEYFRIEPSPEPIALQGDDHRDLRKDGEASDHRTTSVNGERKATSNVFEDILPGPPSMRHIKARIGQKLHEVEEEMAAYRSGYNTLDKKQTVNNDRSKEGTMRREQNSVGVQVDVEKKDSKFKSTGVSSPVNHDFLEQVNTFQVCSSSQTDHPTARSPPMRRERVLITSGVQTDRILPDSHRVMSHAPALPPDIFLNLQMPRPEEDQTLPTDSGFEHRVSPPFLGRQSEADVGVAPHSHIDDVDEAPFSSVPVGTGSRQFLSVADIDREQWLEVKSTPLTASENNTSTEKVDEERKQRERRHNVDEDEDITSRKVRSKSPEVDSDEEKRRRSKQEMERQPFDGADRVTMEMMDSTDVPNQRIPSNLFVSTSRSSARAVATHALNERMKEMNERIEAMDQISQNIDREFKSSRVLLSAIQSIDEVLNPSSNEVKTSRGSEKSHSGKSRKWASAAPWRRELKVTQGLERPTKTEGVEDSVDVAQHTTEKEVKVEGDSDKRDKNSEEDLKQKDEDESNEDNNWSSSQQLVEDESGSIDHQSYLPGVDSEKEPDSREKVEIKDKDDSLKSETKTPVHMEDTPRSTKDRTERDEKAFDPVESISLPKGKLRKMLNEKGTRDTSPEARQQLKEWMNKKRVERKAEWRNQQDERLAQEHKPFMSPTQGSTSFKKMKLIEKDRDMKRRKTEDKHKQKRMESASNLLCEMLAEPIPKPKNPRPNMRYGTGVQSRNENLVSEQKKKIAKKRKKLPKGPQKGYLKPGGLVVLDDETALQDSYASTSYEISITGGTKPAGSLFSEDIPGRFRIQTTPRYDNVVYSSPVSFGEQGLDGSGGDEHNQTFDKLTKKDEIPEDDYWRSNSPTGAEFVTAQTYQNFAKTRTKRIKEREATLRKTPPGVRKGYKLSLQPKGVSAVGRSYSRTQPTDSPFLGSHTLLEIERLLEEEDDDDAFSLDQEKFEGIESLLKGDDELRDLLSDVDWHRSIKKKADSKTLTSQHQSLRHGGERARDEWSSKVSGYRRTRNAEPAIPSSSGLSRFDVELSPWNTAQSLRTSDDVAQLLADVDEAVGNMSQSTGSPRSNIDWDEVEKIMGET